MAQLGVSECQVPAERWVFEQTRNGNWSRMGDVTVLVLLTAIALVLIFVWYEVTRPRPTRHA